MDCKLLLTTIENLFNSCRWPLSVVYCRRLHHNLSKTWRFTSSIIMECRLSSTNATNISKMLFRWRMPHRPSLLNERMNETNKPELHHKIFRKYRTCLQFDAIEFSVYLTTSRRMTWHCVQLSQPNIRLTWFCSPDEETAQQTKYMLLEINRWRRSTGSDGYDDDLLSFSCHFLPSGKAKKKKPKLMIFFNKTTTYIKKLCWTNMLWKIAVCQRNIGDSERWT